MSSAPFSQSIDAAVTGVVSSMRPIAASGDTCQAWAAQHRRLQFEVSRYAEQLLGELVTMTRTADLRHLSYFIEMTRQEAATQAERCRLDL